MFESATQAIEYIEALRGKSNFDHIKALFAAYNNFQDSLKIIHVAGTNGKGSSVSYIRSVLQMQGYKVGTFTSPYLETHNDRIRINNINISDKDFLEISNMLYKEITSKEYTFFEIDTFIALYYMHINNVDYAVIEVGMGGRLDSTNIVKPLISVITNIGYDHMLVLGDTLEKIAFEKAGIIKEKTPVVIGCNMEASAKKVITDFANFQKALLIESKKPEQIKVGSKGLEFINDGKNYEINTDALYQCENASTAITTLNYLKENNIIKLSDEIIAKGIKESIWQGRFEKMNEKPLVYIDGAHNIHGIKALSETLKNIKANHNLKIIFAALGDKETDKMLKELLAICKDITVTDFDFYRCKNAEDLAKGCDVKVSKNWVELINSTIDNASKNDMIIITGSLYFISRVRPMLIERRGK